MLANSKTYSGWQKELLCDGMFNLLRCQCLHREGEIGARQRGISKPQKCILNRSHVVESPMRVIAAWWWWWWWLQYSYLVMMGHHFWPHKNSLGASSTLWWRHREESEENKSKALPWQVGKTTSKVPELSYLLLSSLIGFCVIVKIVQNINMKLLLDVRLKDLNAPKIKKLKKNLKGGLDTIITQSTVLLKMISNYRNTSLCTKFKFLIESEKTRKRNCWIMVELDSLWRETLIINQIYLRLSF